MGKPKTAKLHFCSTCEIRHETPTGKKCTRHLNDAEQSSEKVVAGPSSENGQSVIAGSNDLGSMLLAELKNINQKMESMEQRIATTEKQLQSPGSTASKKHNRAAKPVHVPVLTSTTDEDSSASSEDELVVPSKNFIRRNASIQRQVDARIEELKLLNDQDLQGKVKSQRNVNDDVVVKCRVQWPQNHVLTGSSRSRPSYDSLSVYQWVTGFSRIIHDESDAKVKNRMLEYLADIMEDAQDFSWVSAKACHAVVLCRMEEGKMVWSDTEKLDRVRRSYAQKVVSGQGNGTGASGSSKNKVLTCKFYQNSSCTQSRDHTTGGRKYKHVCSSCSGSHPLKECKSNKNKN